MLRPVSVEPEPEAEEASSYEMTLRCAGARGDPIGGCGREWTETLPLPIRTDVLATRIRTMRCPGCDGRHTELFARME